MDLFIQMLNLQFAMFILIIIGIIAKKRKIVSEQTQKGLSDLLIYFKLPCNIIVSFQGRLTPDLIKNSLEAFVISVIIQLFDKATFYFTFIRLLAFPLLIFTFLKFLKVDPLIIGVSTLLTGMPAGSTTAMLADKYGCDAAFASRVIFVSTVFSIVTIPILCALF